MSAILSPRHVQAEDGDAAMETDVPLDVAEDGAANAPAEAAKKKTQLRISADKLGLAEVDDETEVDLACRRVPNAPPHPLTRLTSSLLLLAGSRQR